MLLVPPDTHQLAAEQGFQLHQAGAPVACCICDHRISTFDWGYRRHLAGNLWDLWCSRCIEEKLPGMVAEGKALR